MKQKVKTGKLRGRKARQKLLGKKKPVVGKIPKKPLSQYLGSIITPENHREYREKQVEHFKEQFTKDVISGREAIMKMEDKTPEEIEVLVDEYNSKQPNEDQLHQMALRFATKMVTKEKKHFEAYIQGKQFFNYAGQNYPVITQKMVNQTQSIHEILKQLEDARAIKSASGDESEDPLRGIGDIPAGDNQTIRSEPGDIEDSGSEEYNGRTEERSDSVLSDSGSDPGQ